MIYLRPWWIQYDGRTSVDMGYKRKRDPEDESMDFDLNTW